MGKYIRGGVNEQLNLGTLAPSTLAAAQFDETVNERMLVSSLVATYSVAEWTPAAGDGPILVGIAHGDYTAAEIEEVIEMTDSWDEGNLVEQELGKRKIRKIGVFHSPQASTEGVSLNDGRPIKTKLNWILNQGQTLQVWAYNMGGSAFATTTPTVHLEGHANLWPR